MAEMNDIEEASSPRGRKLGKFFRTSSPKVKDDVKKISDDVLFLLNSFQSMREEMDRLKQSMKEEMDRLKQDNKQLKWQLAQLSGSVNDIHQSLPVYSGPGQTNLSTEVPTTNMYPYKEVGAGTYTQYTCSTPEVLHDDVMTEAGADHTEVPVVNTSSLSEIRHHNLNVLSGKSSCYLNVY